jgi:hypothetical protein
MSTLQFEAALPETLCTTQLAAWLATNKEFWRHRAYLFFNENSTNLL